MRRIKILRLITRLNVGGPARHAALLTSALNGGLFETRLVAGMTDDHEGDMSFLATDDGIPLTQVAPLCNGSGPLRDLKAFWEIFRIVKREKPDLIHLHLLKARFFGGIAARLARVPLVIETFHGNLFSEYYGKLKTAAILAAEKFLGRLVMDRVIAISESQKQELITYGICPEEKIHVIPLGLDLGRFVQCSKFTGELRKELGISQDTILVGAVGRLAPIKGIGYLVDAISQVARKTERKFLCLIVGDGSLRAELESRAAALGLGGHVRFLGWRFDLERIYADLDIVVLSSLNEGTPVSMIEAMAAGKAVVATRVGGVPDVVEDGANGLVVPPKDPSALARAMLRLFEDEALRRFLGAAARESVYPKYDVARLVADMEAFYLDLVSRSPSHPAVQSGS